MSDSLWPHGLQHIRLPCPSLSPRVCSDSCTLSQWCYLTISFSATLFSCCQQSFPLSGSFPMSRLFESAGQSIGASASTSVLTTSVQSSPSGLVSFRIDWFDVLAVNPIVEAISWSHPTTKWRVFFLKGTLKGTSTHLSQPERDSYTELVLEMTSEAFHSETPPKTLT